MRLSSQNYTPGMHVLSEYENYDFTVGMWSLSRICCIMEIQCSIKAGIKEVGQSFVLIQENPSEGAPQCCRCPPISNTLIIFPLEVPAIDGAIPLGRV